MLQSAESKGEPEKGGWLPGCTHTHTHTRARARARTHTHTHTHTNTHTHTRTHTHTHTHTHTPVSPLKIHRFCRHNDIKSFIRFTLQPKLATEFG